MLRVHRGQLRIVALLVASTLAACAEDFERASNLDGLRVLALESDPIEVGPGETVAVRPILYLPPGAQVRSQAWAFCPLSTGAGNGFTCAAPACETPLDTAADGSTSATPSQLATSCAQALGQAGGPRAVPTLPERVETLLRYRVESDRGEVQEAILRLPLWLQAPPAPRQRPPRLAQVEVGGRALVAGADPVLQLAAGQEVEVRVRVDAGSLDTRSDASGRRYTEEVLVSYFADGGEFDGDRSSGLESTTRWTAGPGPRGEAWLYVVLRDLSGGQSAAGPFRVGVTPR